MVPLTLLVLDMVKSGHCTITMAVAVPLSKVTLGLPLLQVLSLVNVAVAYDDRRVGRQRAGEAVDQVKLIHKAPICCNTASSTTLNALNSTCAAMGASKLLVHSYSAVNTRANTASGTKVATFRWIAANSSAVPHNASRGCPACLSAG